MESELRRSNNRQDQRTFLRDPKDRNGEVRAALRTESPHDWISRMIKLTALALAFAMAAPFASAQSPSDPPPPMPGPTDVAIPFMQTAGEGDVFEVTSSQIAVKRSTTPAVREFASMLIEHHTMTTNVMLTQAKAAGLAPPPAVLGPVKREWIDALLAAPIADFDRVYLSQQVPAHEEALRLHSAYASTGDTPELKTAATGAVTIVRDHLETARRLANASAGL